MGTWILFNTGWYKTVMRSGIGHVSSEIGTHHNIQTLFGLLENRFVGAQFPTTRKAHSNYNALVSERA